MMDNNADFSILNLPKRRTPSVTPFPYTTLFRSASYAFDNLIADRYAGFIANLNYHTISGEVTKSDGGGIAGLTVELQSAQVLIRTSEADGNYAFTDLPAGNNYAVTVSRANSTFS